MIIQQNYRRCSDVRRKF